MLKGQRFSFPKALPLSAESASLCYQKRYSFHDFFIFLFRICLTFLCFQQKCLICFLSFVNICLTCHFPWCMHTEHCHTAVNDFHSIKCCDISDCSASAYINFTKLSCLERNFMLSKIFLTLATYSAFASFEPDLPLAPVNLFNTIPLPR